MRRLALGAVLGALLGLVLDPQNGRRRRHELRDRTLAIFRRGGRKTARAAEGSGLSEKVRRLETEPKELDDATLAHKVESEVFRDPDVPKGQINVNAENGVVYLRGEVDRPELIDALVEKTKNVQGVRDVENLLHLPEAPARAE